MVRCARASIPILLLGWVSAGFAQTATSGQVDDAAAADLARTISLQAASVEVSDATSSDPTPQKAMQGHIDQMVVLASSLEAEIRAGKDKRETRKLYSQLRAARLKAIEFAIYHGVEVDPADRLLFDQMLSGLEAYYSE